MLVAGHFVSLSVQFLVGGRSTNHRRVLIASWRQSPCSCFPISFLVFFFL